MQYTLQVFEDADHDQFRVFNKNGEPWFVLADVCRALGLKNPSDAASRLDDDEKGVAQTDTPGGLQNVRIINESGLYSLILRSEKPEAKRFKKWVTAEVLPTIRKTGGYSARVPAFIRRYNDNWDRVATGYFSVISELAIRVWGRLELAGYVMKDRAGKDGPELRPDVAVGQRFSKWLTEKHPDVSSTYDHYLHVTPEWEGPARQYPNSVVHLFWEYVDTIWIPECAEDYFRVRDPGALPYLPKLLPSPDRPRPGMMKAPTRTLFKRKAG
jgi:prophage antirepressor-like protein